MKRSTALNLISFVCNAAAVIFTAIAICGFFVSGGDGNMKVTGVRCFRYFTNLSNIFAALTCAAALPFNVAAFRRARRGEAGDLRLPTWLFLVKFVAAISVGVTFFTVVFFLAPLWGQNWWKMFAGNTFFLHLVTPLLCLGTLIFCETSRRFRLRSALWGVLPTLVYGTLYFVMVVVLGPGKGGWEDFYSFNMGGLWIVSVAAMLGGTYLLSLGVLALMNRMADCHAEAATRERDLEEFEASAPAEPPVLRVEGLCKSYPARRRKGGRKRGKKLVLDSVGFEVGAGEIVGFLGPNGAGKTTTIRVILGLIRADRGRVSICGHETRTHFEQAMKEVGAVIENPELYRHLTGRGNLEHLAAMSGVPGERIDEVVRLVGLEDAIDEKVARYSLGMRQRLGLAQAVLSRPKLLILDEPTNGLDPEGILRLRDILLGLARTERTAILISSHQLPELDRLCDRVVLIDRGVVIRSMTMEDVRRSAGESAFLIECDLRGAALPEGAEIVREGVLRVRTSREEIPSVLAELISAGASVCSVTPEARSLEDVFLSAVGHRGEQAPGDEKP